MKLVLQDEKLLVYYCTVFKVSTSSKYHVGVAKTQLDVWEKNHKQNAFSSRLICVKHSHIAA